MKIINLQVENLKRITAVDITPPDQGLVQITGKNGAGKTTLLDAILWAIAGAGTHEPQPIRDGADKGVVRMDLGKYIVTRGFRRRKDGKGHTTQIRVENAEGAIFSSPQAMLSKLKGDISFDPLAFSRAGAKGKMAIIQALIPGLDLESDAAANKKDYDERTLHNRNARSYKAAADQIIIPPDTPDEPLNVLELSNVLVEAHSLARDREVLQGERDEQDKAIAHNKERLVTMREAVAELEQAIVDQQNAIKSREPLADAPDTEALRVRLDQASRINDAVHNAKRRKQLMADSLDAAKQAEKATARMAARTQKANAAIAAAQLPVDGLSLHIKDEQAPAVLFNGLPFEQASDADKLRVSCALAMHANPTLRVIRVRDGSLLDSASLALLGEIATDADFQVWIERVDESGKIGFVIEDGHVAEGGKR